MSLFWWPIQIGGEYTGELCDSCMVEFRDFMEEYQ